MNRTYLPYRPPDYVSRLERKVIERNVQVVLLAVCCWLLIAVSLYARSRFMEAREIIQTYEKNTADLVVDHDSPARP